MVRMIMVCQVSPVAREEKNEESDSQESTETVGDDLGRGGSLRLRRCPCRLLTGSRLATPRGFARADLHDGFVRVAGVVAVLLVDVGPMENDVEQ